MALICRRISKYVLPFCTMLLQQNLTNSVRAYRVNANMKYDGLQLVISYKVSDIMDRTYLITYNYNCKPLQCH
jgi:hypothetical protein